MFENNQSQSRWRPGLPVLTAADHADWTQWRKDRKRQQQRDRRARYPRIDYYPDGDALALIDSLRGPCAGGDASSVLNRIVMEWAEATGTEVPPE